MKKFISRDLGKNAVSTYKRASNILEQEKRISQYKLPAAIKFANINNINNSSFSSSSVCSGTATRGNRQRPSWSLAPTWTTLWGACPPGPPRRCPSWQPQPSLPRAGRSSRRKRRCGCPPASAQPGAPTGGLLGACGCSGPRPKATPRSRRSASSARRWGAPGS